MNGREDDPPDEQETNVIAMSTATQHRMGCLSMESVFTLGFRLLGCQTPRAKDL
jgi:hypothetical protein